MTSNDQQQTAEAAQQEQQELNAEAQNSDAQADQAAEASEPAAAEANPYEQQLAEAKAQADEHYQRYLRTQADFDNFRRRSRQEKEEFLKYASAKLIEQLIPVVDNFDRALTSSKDTKDFDALVKGLEMTFRQLDQILSAEGLQPMNAVGQPFNPEFHQAIMQVESEEHGEGIVIEEVQKGYMLKDKVIRPAMVKVSV